jgi:hypothetical protein
MWEIGKEGSGSITSRREVELVTWVLLRNISCDVDVTIKRLKDYDPLHYLDSALIIDV